MTQRRMHLPRGMWALAGVGGLVLAACAADGPYVLPAEPAAPTRDFRADAERSIGEDAAGAELERLSREIAADEAAEAR